MTGFDVTVFAVVGAAASIGFLRGFVQEAISLSAFIFSMLAVRLLQAQLSAVLLPHLGTQSGADVASFLILLVLPYIMIRMLARYLGGAARQSVLGPIDRVLGFGFGAVKGTLIAVAVFSLVVLFYDTIWGVGGRPKWITTSRTYSFINASSNEVIRIIAARHRAASEAASETDSDSPKSAVGNAGPVDDDAQPPNPARKAHPRPHHKAT